MKQLISYLLLFLLSFSLYAQVPPRPVAKPTTPVKGIPVRTRLLFLLDASGSMANEWQGSTRMNIAKNVLKKLVDSLQNIPNLEMGMRVYGSMSALNMNDCKDTRLEAPIRPANGNFIKLRLDAIVTRGITPIAYSMQQVLNDFGATPSTGPTRNVVLLITDGIESCGGNLCEVSLQLQRKGIVLNPFIIGMGMRPEEAATFDCAGRYYDATTAKGFKEIAKNVVNQITNITTAQINLLDQNGKPSESNVPVTFTDATTNGIRYSFVQTMNNRGFPDTLSIDPVNIYNLKVHTTPPTELKDVTLIPDRHNTISVKAAQGDLSVLIDGNTNTTSSITCLVHTREPDSLIATQETGSSQRYLAGKYRMEVLCLPRIVVETEVVASKTTTIRIPNPGLLNLINSNAVPVLGSIYVEDGREIHWLADINGATKSESIALQPGNYRIVYRTKASKRSMSTQEKSFRITPGNSETFRLN